jgi:hypothetical protein
LLWDINYGIEPSIISIYATRGDTKVRSRGSVLDRKSRAGINLSEMRRDVKGRYFMTGRAQVSF